MARKKELQDQLRLVQRIDAQHEKARFVKNGLIAVLSWALNQEEFVSPSSKLALVNDEKVYKEV